MRVFWRVTAAMHIGWLVGTFVGVSLGNVIGDADRFGLDTVFPAALLAIIGGLLRQRSAALAAAVGGGLCLLLIPIAPAGVPIIASLLGAFGGSVVRVLAVGTAAGMMSWTIIGRARGRCVGAAARRHVRRWSPCCHASRPSAGWRP